MDVLQPVPMPSAPFIRMRKDGHIEFRLYRKTIIIQVVEELVVVWVEDGTGDCTQTCVEIPRTG